MKLLRSPIVVIGATTGLGVTGQSGLIKYPCDDKPCQNGGTCINRSQADGRRRRIIVANQFVKSDQFVTNSKLHLLDDTQGRFLGYFQRFF